MAKLVAITGGIGSGKSVVSRILRTMGYEVYDCDSKAKALVESTPAAVEQIVKHFGAEAVDGGKVNWKYLSSFVFNHKEAIAVLNGIIHPLVRQDVSKWAQEHVAKQYVFVETAILKESNMDSIVDGVWLVTAPQELRVERVMARNGITADAVLARIKAQKEYSGNGVEQLVNDGNTPLLPRIIQLLHN